MPYFLASGFPTFLVLSVNILVLVNSIIILFLIITGDSFHLSFFIFFLLFPLPPLFCLSSIHPKHKLYLIDRSRSSSSSSSLAFRRPDLNATYSSVFFLSLSLFLLISHFPELPFRFLDCHLFTINNNCSC